MIHSWERKVIVWDTQSNTLYAMIGAILMAKTQDKAQLPNCGKLNF
ncbi:MULTISPECIES: hypothetical protein [unclassified Mucilaginibacter]|nr:MULTISPECIES: hypothetical protein [unclassified Mucilaginibacter]MEB0260568.1 hypothetical protein [Mucilaginibacter sp. 10I4]MEB0278076.1 hypothetical protein [Mucilaginibacter sp. 10B2]MEB0302939.1 hypothetical protein [Mucilaginibacter sp. 5C4]WPX22987.1 hypothetical protein RHM67_17035 [Mucilaginibacter sp. 5C4]